MTHPAAHPGSSGIAAALPLVFGSDARGLGRALDEIHAGGDERGLRSLIRLALLQPDRTTLWYQRLVQRWEDLGRPGLKPNPIARRMAILSDHTVQNLVPLVRGMSAAFGIELSPAVGDYDSVEMAAFDASSPVYREEPDFVAVSLSWH